MDIFLYHEKSVVDLSQIKTWRKSRTARGSIRNSERKRIGDTNIYGF